MEEDSGDDPFEEDDRVMTETKVMIRSKQKWFAMTLTLKAFFQQTTRLLLPQADTLQFTQLTLKDGHKTKPIQAAVVPIYHITQSIKCLCRIKVISVANICLLPVALFSNQRFSHESLFCIVFLYTGSSLKLSFLRDDGGDGVRLKSFFHKISLLLNMKLVKSCSCSS